jgi:NADH:ubiquinone oxidoreductase subunit E
MVTIYVCIGSVCYIKGSYKIINIFQHLIQEQELEDKVELKAAFCMDGCSGPVSVRVGDNPVMSVSENTAVEFFSRNVMEKI